MLNLAFAGAPTWRLLCPYDVSALPDDVIEEARANHPLVMDGGRRSASDAHHPQQARRALRPRPRAPPSEPPVELPFTTGELAAVRRRVEGHCTEVGLPAGAAQDLVLCADEIATNSLVHGGGSGVLRLWCEPEALVCEISDRGTIADPLVGRESPSPDRLGGRGMWLANQLCDLVQVRSGPAGTVVRLHVRLGLASV